MPTLDDLRVQSDDLRVQYEEILRLRAELARLQARPPRNTQVRPKKPKERRRRFSPRPDARLLISSPSAGLRMPFAGLPVIPSFDSEILDPPSRFQLRDQPARPLATTGPSL
jgi:hypothetical protein